MRCTRKQADLVKRFADQFGLKLRAAQNHRKKGTAQWLLFLKTVADATDCSTVDFSSVKFDSVEKMLERLEQTEVRANELLRRAEAAGKISDLPVLAKHHADAAKQVLLCRAEFLKIEEAEGRLISVDNLRESVRRLLVPLRSELSNMPRQLGIMVNPLDAAHAEEVLQQWVSKVSVLIENVETEI